MDIYFATGNEGKVDEASDILSDFEVRQLDLDLVEPSIDSLEEIALEKVKQAREKSDIEDSIIIADDSGLFIENLNGFPGPQTAFFDRKVGKEKILDLIDSGAEAEFRAAVAVDFHDKDDKVFTGRVKGEIVEPEGDEGFGYDPLFRPEGSEKTWGEDSDQKDENSHRREALMKLLDYISAEFN
jgi:XTP/dITP diphosphohydrolase